MIFRNLLIIGWGGVGCAVLHVLRALVFERFGFLPSTFRALAGDYVTDPPEPPSRFLPNHFRKDTWQQTLLNPSELALIGSYNGISMKLVQMMADGNSHFAWLDKIIDAQLLREYVGRREAAQKPAIARLALAMNIAFGGLNRDPSWFTKLEHHLTALSPKGEAVHSLIRSGVQEAKVLSSPIVVLIVVGSSGGTGNGLWIPTAVAVQDVAERSGLQVDVRLHQIAGLYREPDSTETRKLALTRTMDEQVDEALYESSREWNFPTGPDRYIRHSGPIIRRAFRHEVSERFKFKYGAVIADAGRTILYEYFSHPGFEAEKVWTNSAA